MQCVIFIMFCCINASVVTVYELISVKSTQTKAPHMEQVHTNSILWLMWIWAYTKSFSSRTVNWELLEKQWFIREFVRQSSKEQIPGICLQYRQLREWGQEASDAEDRGFFSFIRWVDDLMVLHRIIYEKMCELSYSCCHPWF